MSGGQSQATLYLVDSLGLYHVWWTMYVRQSQGVVHVG